jgi:hypothetical protein
VFDAVMATTVIDKKVTIHPRFPSWYDPKSAEVVERRKKLFTELKNGRTPETDAAMNEFADRVLRKFVLK